MGRAGVWIAALFVGVLAASIPYAIVATAREEPLSEPWGTVLVLAMLICGVGASVWFVRRRRSPKR